MLAKNLVGGNALAAAPVVVAASINVRTVLDGAPIEFSSSFAGASVRPVLVNTVAIARLAACVERQHRRFAGQKSLPGEFTRSFATAAPVGFDGDGSKLPATLLS